MEQDKYYQNWDNCNDDPRAYDLPLRAILPLELKQCRGYYAQAVLRHVLIRDIKVVVNSDSFYNDHRGDCWPEQRQNDAAIYREVACPINDCRFIQRYGNSRELLHKNIDGDYVGADVQKETRHPRIVHT